MLNDEKQSILIIDDDLTIRKLLGHHLKHNNYTVFEAAGPEEGFVHLKTTPIDLVLCDVTMDEMDGFTFCKKVRENEKYRGLPFIFVTAKTSLEDKSLALEVGGDDFITKPFDVNDLLLKVKTLIKRSSIYKTYGVKKNLAKSFANDTIKILLVDDDQLLAKLFQFNLNKTGFDCQIAFSAEDGFKLTRSFMPDIIISDIMMPIADGFEFRKKLLEDPYLKAIPFIFLTSKSEEDEILKGYEYGITDYIVKTAGPKVVVAKVSAIIKSLGKEKQKVIDELYHAADSLRFKVVPESNPTFEGFQIKHWHQTYKGIPGGDFIDYFYINDDTFAIILGDVMGKKWGAWYFAFAYAGYVRSAVRVILQSSKEYTPSTILQQINKSVYEDAKVSEVFATLSVVIIDKKNKQLKYTGAGDLPIIFRCSATNEIKKIQAQGSLLGFSENGGFEDVVVDLHPNDIVFMVTDGIMESRNTEGEQFGHSRMSEVITSINSHIDPLDYIMKEFSTFTGEKFEDDISIIMIKNL